MSSGGETFAPTIPQREYGCPDSDRTLTATQNRNRNNNKNKKKGTKNEENEENRDPRNGGCGGDDDTNEVTPDTTIVCPKCHLRIRVGRRMSE